MLPLPAGSVPGRRFCGPPARRPPDRNAGGRIGALAVGFAAIADAGDFDVVAVDAGKDAVVLGAKTIV